MPHMLSCMIDMLNGTLEDDCPRPYRTFVLISDQIHDNKKSGSSRHFTYKGKECGFRNYFFI